jgi:hypothetical protein
MITAGHAATAWHPHVHGGILDANANAPALLVMQQSKRLGSSNTAQDQHARKGSDCVLLACLISLNAIFCSREQRARYDRRYTTWQDMAVLELLPILQRDEKLRPKVGLCFRSQDKICYTPRDHQSRSWIIRVPYSDHAG